MLKYGYFGCKYTEYVTVIPQGLGETYKQTTPHWDSSEAVI